MSARRLIALGAGILLAVAIAAFFIANVVTGGDGDQPVAAVDDAAAAPTTEAPSTSVTTTTTSVTTTTSPPTTTVDAEPSTAEDAPTSTAAPAPSDEDPGASTAAPATPSGEFDTMWDALVENGDSDQFAAIVATLGFQADLETLETPGGSAIMRTIFAPSDQALADLGAEATAALVADADAANALVGHHFLDASLTADDLLGLDGGTLPSSVGLPIQFEAVDGELVLNGVARVVSTDLTAENGIVHVIDTVLSPSGVN